jgi:hypothetical protein
MPNTMSRDETRGIARDMVTRADRIAASWPRRSWHAANVRLSEQLFHLSMLERIPPGAIAALRAQYDQEVMPFDDGSYKFHGFLDSLESPGEATPGCLGYYVDPATFPYAGWYRCVAAISGALLIVLVGIAVPRHQGFRHISTSRPLWSAIAATALVIFTAMVINSYMTNRAARRRVYVRCGQCGHKVPAGADRCASCGARTDFSAFSATSSAAGG